MDSSTSVPSTSTAVSFPTSSSFPDDSATVPHHGSPVVAFIIGLAIVILASILNAGGLNLTKLDHVRTSAIPKSARRKDWLRPLWLLGMVLYILSQLIGSTLALEYMRAEYVAPLGSTSLIFNFLFAKYLLDTPVTRHDIYGTVIVILGVIGIVAFGSINSGLAEGTNAAHLTYLWTRGNWLAYFFLMAFSLLFVYIFISQLDQVLAARSDLSAAPFSSMGARMSSRGSTSVVGRVVAVWDKLMMWLRERLEVWTEPHDDKRIAWTLGIGWACCGGGLAGGCLVFAKAAVKLISGSLSHENTGNQFGHASSIFTFLLLGVTAVSQILCLNRGLKVYDSTLVVPVFYGVYTAAGFLDSLIFNDYVDAYKPWTLFFVFVSMMVLISGVVLLTYEKPQPAADKHGPHVQLASRPRRRNLGAGDGEDSGLRAEGDDADVEADGEMWQLGDASDDEVSRPGTPLKRTRSRQGQERVTAAAERDEPRESTSSDATLARPETASFLDDEFGGWESAKQGP